MTPTIPRISSAGIARNGFGRSRRTGMFRSSSRWRLLLGTAVGTAAVLGAGLTTSSTATRAAGSDAGSADQVGSWSNLFEEGGVNTPRCTKGADGRKLCKPVGYAQAMLPDGRVMYFNGIEGSDNVQFASGPELSPESRNARSRVLDLRSGIPTWMTPVHEDGGGKNPNIRPGDNCQGSDPLGVAGVPGRPGDGLVGSLVGGAVTGTATGIEHNPTCTPDTGIKNDGDMFCADFANLGDGRIIVVGGTSWYNEPGDGIDRDHGYPYDLGAVELEGLRTARIFDAKKNDWTTAAPMKYGRWYPNATTLSDGKVLVTSGVTKLIKSTQMSQVRRSEVYDPATNTWTEQYTGPQSENSLPLMARTYLTPNNKLFYTGGGQMWGPFGQAADEALFALQQFFNLETKQWEVTGPNPLGPRSGDYVGALPMTAPYDKMTLIAFGGNLGPPPGGEFANPLTQLITVDKQGHVENKMGANLHHPRWFVAGVPLPDGKFLAINGADKDEVTFPGTESAIRTPELYDPATNTWTDMAAESRDRTYHNAAILLPDGRVLSGGHSPIPNNYGHQQTTLPGVTANNVDDPSFQIWSPPYLYYGPRPVITHAPAGLAWGETTDITVADPSSIANLVLMRTPSQQHVIDNDQRTLVVPFTATGNTLHITVPQDGVVAPPGTYYLFANRKNPKGLTPSVARMVFVGATHNSAEAANPMKADAQVTPNGATPVEDTSAMTQIAGGNGAKVNSTVAGAVRPAIDRSETSGSDGLAVLTARLAGLVRSVGEGGPAPLILGGLLAALAAGLGIRARRWMIHRSRR